MLTSQILLRGELAPRPPADLFVPAQRQVLDLEPEPDPVPGRAGTGSGDPQPSGIRRRGLLPIAITAVLLSGLLDAVTIVTFPELSRLAFHDAPPSASDQLGSGRAGIGVEPPPR
jgi:hypothetical protein